MGGGLPEDEGLGPGAGMGVLFNSREGAVGGEGAAVGLFCVGSGVGAENGACEPPAVEGAQAWGGGSMCGPLRKDHLGPPGLAGPPATGVRLRFQVRRPKEAGEGLERGQQGASVGSPRPLPGLRGRRRAASPTPREGSSLAPPPARSASRSPLPLPPGSQLGAGPEATPGRRLHPPPGLRHTPTPIPTPQPYQPRASGRTAATPRTAARADGGCGGDPAGAERSGDVRAASALGVGRADAEAHPPEGREGIGAGLRRRSPRLPSTPSLAARSSIPCAPSS